MLRMAFVVICLKDGGRKVSGTQPSGSLVDDDVHHDEPQLSRDENIFGNKVLTS